MQIRADVLGHLEKQAWWGWVTGMSGFAFKLVPIVSTGRGVFTGCKRFLHHQMYCWAPDYSTSLYICANHIAKYPAFLSVEACFYSDPHNRRHNWIEGCYYSFTLPKLIKGDAEWERRPCLQFKCTQSLSGIYELFTDHPHRADGSFWMICFMMKSFWDREENTTRQKPCRLVFRIWCSSFQAFHWLLLKHASEKPERWEILNQRGGTGGRLPSTKNSGNDPSQLNNLCTCRRWPDDAGDAALVQVAQGEVSHVRSSH